MTCVGTEASSGCILKLGLTLSDPYPCLCQRQLHGDAACRKEIPSSCHCKFVHLRCFVLRLTSGNAVKLCRLSHSTVRRIKILFSPLSVSKGVEQKLITFAHSAGCEIDLCNHQNLWLEHVNFHPSFWQISFNASFTFSACMSCAWQPLHLLTKNLILTYASKRRKSVTFQGVSLPSWISFSRCGQYFWQGVCAASHELASRSHYQAEKRSAYTTSWAAVIR